MGGIYGVSEGLQKHRGHPEAAGMLPHLGRDTGLKGHLGGLGDPLDVLGTP